MFDYNSGRLYEDAFNISYKWKEWLPLDVYRYHELICKEVNAPVQLQMTFYCHLYHQFVDPYKRAIFDETFLLKFILAEYSSIMSRKITDKEMHDFTTTPIYTAKYR